MGLIAKSVRVNQWREGDVGASLNCIVQRGQRRLRKSIVGTGQEQRVLRKGQGDSLELGTGEINSASYKLPFLVFKLKNPLTIVSFEITIKYVL